MQDIHVWSYGLHLRVVCTGSKCDPQTKANGVILPRDITGKACNQAPDSFLEGGGGGKGGGGGGAEKSLALDKAV